ncbi:MAG TPA: polyamine aminopropyltransferase [Burkholderiales bacterium]|nr:polyamine aminopropyltransferase [Burkholderiales bacterium]
MGLLTRWRRQRVDDEVQISEQDGIRYLHLGSETIQSGMRMSEPTELVLSYTRSMLAFLLFAPEPRRLVNIGLGGGSLAKWIHRHLHQTQQVVLEINPRVIACARQYFYLPQDDARLKIIEADGAQWVSAHADCCEVILVDGYDGRSPALELGTQSFYESARRCLGEEGILAVNLWGNDRRFDQFVRRIQAAFDGQICCVPAAQRGNVAVLAFKRIPTHTRWDELRGHAERLQCQFGIEFPDIVGSLKVLNPHTHRRLLI